MQLSIIIPVYNTALYLAACMDSVLRQSSAESVEVICVNDGSTDDSATILHTYAERYSNVRIISQPNGGLSAARNTGLRAANGEYVLFLDSDDRIKPDTLSILDANLSECPDILAFGSELWYYENEYSVPNDKFNHRQYDRMLSGQQYLDQFVCERGWGPSAACFYAYRRTFLRQHSLCFPVGLLHEDELFVPQACALAQNVKILSNILYEYRMRENSIVHSAKLKSYQDKMVISEYLYDFFKNQHFLTLASRRIVYNLRLNAILGLKNYGQKISCVDVMKNFIIAPTLRDKMLMLKKIYL